MKKYSQKSIDSQIHQTVNKNKQLLDELEEIKKNVKAEIKK